MYQLDEPIYFYILFSIPFIWTIFFFLSVWKKKTQKQFISSKMLEKLSPEKSNFKGFLKLIIIIINLHSFKL